jgi:hypothetical protein
VTTKQLFLGVTLGILGAFALLVVGCVGCVILFAPSQEDMRRAQADFSAMGQQGMQQIERRVAADAVKQYEIAKRNGNPIDAYVHAGMVAAAYLQAKDEENYKKWKAIESAEARRAGMLTP